MGGIFISYRRGDSGLYAGRLRDTLSHHFGAEQVFRDIDSVEPGERFPRLIEQEVGSCDALLALIGPTWQTITDDAGQRRLDHPDDYVRLEIATALGRGDDVLVIPVLVGPTSMPAAADLPKPLAALAERNALHLSDESWDDQVARLTRVLEKVVKPRVVAPRPPHVATPQAEVTAAVKVGAGNARPIAGWLRRKMRPDTSPTALIRSADHLAEAVARREMVLLDQLRAGPDTVMDDLKFEDQAGVGFPSSEIDTYFRRRASQRRLLVIGEAGAGKTVLAVRLLLDQLRDRAGVADDLRGATPVPVRVNVAGWDGGGDFTGWLAGRMMMDYGLHQQVARAMVDAGYILPVLDGLDEMDPPDAQPDRARGALDRLNEPPWRNRTVVVMCRTGVYARLRELRGDAGLHGAITITLLPLSPIEICDYLHHYGDQLGIPAETWVPVTDQIRDDPNGPLATALRTPWLLGLAATALRRDRRTATALAACRDTTEITDLLFAALIPAAIQGMHRTGPTRDYTELKVQTWMQTLAQHLERRRAAGMGGTEITLDRVWELAGTRRVLALYALAVGLTGGLAGGLAGGLMAGLVFGLTGGLAAGLAGGLFMGVQWGLQSRFLLLPARFKAKANAPKRLAWRVPGRSRWRRGLAYGLGAGPMYALLAGCLYWFLARFAPGPTAGLPAVLVAGLVVAFVAGPVYGLVTSLETNSDDRLALGQDARQIIHDDLVFVFVAVLVNVAMAALMAGLPVGLAFGLVGGLVGGLAFGILAGLFTGLGQARPAGRYATASLVFALNDQKVFAQRPAQFLEWARNAGLLRVTGIAYQCRHDSYQQWLAAGDGDRGVKTRLDARAD